MAAQIDLPHRFDPGSVVALVRVHDERQLRAEGGVPVDARHADRQGSVTFASGVEPGARYIAVGLRDRHPLEVRARGEQTDAAPPQPPLGPDRPQRFRRPLNQPTAETSARRQEDVNGAPQRSNTPTDAATPVD